jgi:hypothetical protein
MSFVRGNEYEGRDIMKNYKGKNTAGMKYEEVCGQRGPLSRGQFQFRYRDSHTLRNSTLSSENYFF